MSSSSGRSKKSLSEKQRAELYVAAGGRCEFPNCGDRVDLHDTTKERVAYWEAAHVIAASADGPRGDPERSEELADKVENHLLLCRSHHKPIDTESQGHAYTEAELLEFKERHEKHIEALLDIPLGQRTAAVVVQGRIANQQSRFRAGAINNAIVQCSNYTLAPARSYPIIVDLNEIPGENADPGYHAHAASAIRRKLDLALDDQDVRDTPISLFALAPMPDLVSLGYALGNKRQVFNHQPRHDGGWLWREPNATTPVEYEIDWPKETQADEVALVLSLSGNVDETWVKRVAGAMPRATIRTPSPSRQLVRCPDDITAFSRTITGFFGQLASIAPNTKRIHMFPAMPAPLCVEFGRQIPPKQKPDFVVYDHRSDDAERSDTPIPLDLTD